MVFDGFERKKYWEKKCFLSVCSVYWMCSLWYGTGPWSSASHIPAKWLHEWLTQWQLFLSCEHLCKIWIWIFLFLGVLSCSLTYLICSGKREEIHCVDSNRAHLQRFWRGALSLALYSTRILFWQSRDIYCISLSFGRLFRRGDSSYLYSHLRVPTNTLLLSDRFTLDLPCEGSVKTFQFCKLL